jgi:hypothetical protein
MDDVLDLAQRVEYGFVQGFEIAFLIGAGYFNVITLNGKDVPGPLVENALEGRSQDLRAIRVRVVRVIGERVGDKDAFNILATSFRVGQNEVGSSNNTEFTINGDERGGQSFEQTPKVFWGDFMLL